MKSKKPRAAKKAAASDLTDLSMTLTINVRCTYGMAEAVGKGNNEAIAAVLKIAAEQFRSHDVTMTEEQWSEDA